MPIQRFTSEDSTKVWEHLNRVASDTEELVSTTVADATPSWDSISLKPEVVGAGATKKLAREAIGAGVVDSTTVSGVWMGTQAAYDAVVFKDPAVLYFIKVV